MIDDSAISRPLSVGSETKALLRLAVPVIGSRIGMLTMSLIDTIMLGRFATAELAYQSIAI
ncbi:MAG: hypothetical protein HOB86_10970, partial [Rhodospirillaceae bacterium]|nr:hypothetical protein [Rhodospirillaceae bacterium]